MASILLVEDELWVGELYQQLLSREHQVVWCRTGHEAITCIDDSRPDVIVLDIMLPWTNGIGLLHEIASYLDTAAIPVILFSAALPRQLDSDMLRAYGVVATLDKTTTKPHKVLATVNGVLRVYADLSN